LVLAKPDGHKDPSYLSAAVRKNRVTTLQLVPSMIRLFLKEPAIAECESLRNVFSGGEALTAELSGTFFERLSARLHNLYGPTETCIQAIVYSCNRTEQFRSATVPIGRPIANTLVYVLDDDLQLVPIGAEGELYIGGAGLARGYCGREDLTRQRFIENPFGCPGTRLYRTGDRARYRPDGNLEFVGRADGQVKVRGYRVELGEVEGLLMTLPSVREAAVAVADDPTGNKRLIAYIVASDGHAEETSRLHSYLAKSLPDFMIPFRFVYLPELPRLTSGKVDRNALLASNQPVRGTGDSGSLSDAESAMADIWERVLEVQNIGPNDDFFDLGGSSMQLLYVFAEANQFFGSSVSVDAVTRGATLVEMASLFQETRAGSFAAAAVPG
jgi:nonribosomal peptide synthetase DhbF